MSIPDPKTAMDLLYKRIEASGFESLTQSERSFFALWWFFVETNNGGLDQFFTNSSGELANDALHGLRLFGAPQLEAILNQAMSLFPNGQVPADRDRRTQIVESLNSHDAECLDQLTTQFYAHAGELGEPLIAYVAAHQSEFPSFAPPA